MFNHKIASLEARIARLEAHLSRKASQEGSRTKFASMEFGLAFHDNLKYIQKIKINSPVDQFESMVGDVEVKTSGGLWCIIALIPQGDTILVSVRGDYRRVMKNEFDNTIDGANEAAQWVASYLGQEPR